MSKSRTADDVEFHLGMTLFALNGQEFIPSKTFDYGDTIWVEESNPEGHSGVVDSFFSSKESLQKFLDSPQNTCFCCKTQCGPIHSSDHGSLHTICMCDGLIFRATGNYGSTIFDPMTYQVLQIRICDNCVKQRIDQVTYFPPDGSKSRGWKLEQEEFYNNKRPKSRK